MCYSPTFPRLTGSDDRDRDRGHREWGWQDPAAKPPNVVDYGVSKEQTRFWWKRQLMGSIDISSRLNKMNRSKYKPRSVQQKPGETCNLSPDAAWQSKPSSALVRVEPTAISDSAVGRKVGRLTRLVTKPKSVSFVEESQIVVRCDLKSIAGWFHDFFAAPRSLTPALNRDRDRGCSDNPRWNACRIC